MADETDNYEATDEGCPICGAAVANESLHKKWHAQAPTRADVANAATSAARAADQEIGRRIRW